MNRRRFLIQSATALAAGAVPLAFAQQPTRIVVGFAAGGPGDILARAVAEALKRHLGDTIIVENRPGAAGRIAINMVKSAEADGLTLLNTPASLLTLLPHAVKAGDFNPLADLAPVGTMSDLDFALAINGKLPARSLAEYLQGAGHDVKTASFGTPGAGTPQHMLGAMLGKAANINLTHVPYKGGAPALQDVIGGVLPAVISTISDPMLNAARDGRLRILATGGARRSSFLPEVPTMAESGYRNVVASDCTGLLVPARTPAATIARLSRALIEVVASAEFKTTLNRFYMEPLAMDARAYGDKLRTEYAAWGPVVKATGFTLDS